MGMAMRFERFEDESTNPKNWIRILIVHRCQQAASNPYIYDIESFRILSRYHIRDFVQVRKIYNLSTIKHAVDKPNLSYCIYFINELIRIFKVKKYVSMQPSRNESAIRFHGFRVFTLVCFFEIQIATASYRLSYAKTVESFILLWKSTIAHLNSS